MLCIDYTTRRVNEKNGRIVGAIIFGLYDRAAGHQWGKGKQAQATTQAAQGVWLVWFGLIHSSPQGLAPHIDQADRTTFGAKGHS
jgi:sulfite exporter TauE/SafE